MTDELVDKLSRGENGQQEDAGAVTQTVADFSDTLKAETCAPTQRVVKVSIKKIKEKPSRKRVQINADQFQTAGEDEALMNDIFNPSFNGLLRDMPIGDRDDDRVFLETARAYLMGRRERARSAMGLSNRLSDFKRYVRFQAKLAIIDILLSAETQEAIRRTIGQGTKSSAG